MTYWGCFKKESFKSNVYFCSYVQWFRNYILQLLTNMLTKCFNMNAFTTVIQN